MWNAESSMALGVEVMPKQVSNFRTSLFLGPLGHLHTLATDSKKGLVSGAFDPRSATNSHLDTEQFTSLSALQVL